MDTFRTLGITSQAEEPNRPARPRANTTFTPFSWRRGRAESALPPNPEPVVPLSLEQLIEALTPPAVPSLSHARALASILATHSPLPRLVQLSPILAGLCSSESPVSLQAAGYDILAAYWENSGSVVLATADRLICLSLFMDSTQPWSSELWESRFKALVALIHSGAESIGMESSLVGVLRGWIESAFAGMANDSSLGAEERNERQRSVETMSSFLISLVGRAEFVSRLQEADTGSVLALFGNMIDWSLVDLPGHAPPLASPLTDAAFATPVVPQRTASARHHRQHSSLSTPHPGAPKSSTDVALEAFLNYLEVRLKAIAPIHLKTILRHLFRALVCYATPLPRISLTPGSPDQNSIEKRIMDVLDSLMTGPFSSSCTVILKYHLFPDKTDLPYCVLTTIGALRSLRASIRRVLSTRLARSYISRTSSMNYMPSGAPGPLSIHQDLLERAWAKDDLTSWNLQRFRGVLCRSIEEWIGMFRSGDTHLRHSCERMLNEIAGILKDITQAFDEIGDELDYEEVDAVGEVLRELSAFVRLQRYPDGTPMRIALTQVDAVNSFLFNLSSLLAQDLTVTPLHSVLPSVILSIVEHIPDSDTAHLVTVMAERQAFSPTTPSWLSNWNLVMTIGDLYTEQRSLTRQVIMDVLLSVWQFVKDIAVHRRPLAALVFDDWRQQDTGRGDDHTAIIIWRILGDEIVLRSAEQEDGAPDIEDARDGNLAEEIIQFLESTAAEPQDEELELFMPTPPSSSLLNPTSVASSPVLSRIHSEYSSPSKEKDSGMPSVMSLFSSLTSGHTTRSHSQPPHSVEPIVTPEPPPPLPEQTGIPKPVGAVVALVTAFSQLAFTSLATVDAHLDLAARMFKTFVQLLGGAASTRAKLTILQFLMRLRVDRDHRLYYASNGHDPDGQIAALAALVHRSEKDKSSSALDDRPQDDHDLRKSRTRLPQPERMGRRLSRGRGGGPSASGSSRSRSRAASRIMHPAVVLKKLKPREPLWTLPETLPFEISAEADTPSERLASYDPAGPHGRTVLPLSSYLTQVVNIIKSSRDWDLLSYILCHLPTQLSNKHLFCGPKSSVILKELLAAICGGILEGHFASSVERWPDGLIARDAQGLAYHTLVVLISYRRCYTDILPRHRLIESFLMGLSGQPSTIKCCLHALGLSAFELQPSMTKYLPRILERLSQIMSNPTMAVHIIDFLAIVGALPNLHSNFTEGDYKMVFGVALQYLQQHTRPESAAAISWALSQHVCIMAYYIVYIWFLAVKLPDRPRHIKYITRQLLLANEGKEEVDESTEVCFDWLARYTYASADPRPANSMLNDVLMHPRPRATEEPALAEKTWVLGNSVVTIRSLERRGWVEVVSRRASGLTKFLCRAENVPMVMPGDVDPDLLSVCGILAMDRTDVPEAGSEEANVLEGIQEISGRPPDLPRPDPITGYVWSRSAPSQRRKEVAIDPSYFALQLSSYPDSKPSTLGRHVSDTSKLGSFIRSIDRMPVIDTHKVGILYVAPGQSHERDILENTHGSPAYTRFLEGLGRLIDLRGQVDVYAGGLDPDEDGEYAYAWWDDIGQVLYHTATMMPSGEEGATNKKRHIGNDYVRIVWNDAGRAYAFDTLATQFQFVNIVIEPHSRGAIAAFSDNLHEHEYFKVTLQRAPGMPEFTPVGEFKLISAENLPLLVRQLSLLTDWFVEVYHRTQNDTEKVEFITNWRARLQAIKRFRGQVAVPTVPEQLEGILGQQTFRDFTTAY